ncbi:hypothetical protein Ddye_012934 [Dipteronia dyeriana]|uniref:SWIM-type domain-containing protein n=1 Tax=Dipteronia dyeriana TaxID=168575 RepID=A0AAD9X5M9_9ROSI|nr:hypothetical protein Ddye_012934 [Dipteronia dyeriana]
MVFVPPDLKYHGLMNTIEDIVRIDSSTFNIELRAVMTTSGRRAIPRIKNDRDVTFSMGEERVIPEVYVTTVGRSVVNDPAYTINDASLGVGTNNEVGASTSEFETFVDNGLDGLREPYPFEQDVDGDGDGDSDSVFDLDGDSDTDSYSGDIDGEGESGCDLDAIGDSGCELDGDSGSDIDSDVDCGCELDVDSDGCGHDRGDSFAAPLPWIILGAEKYSIQTINNDEPSISNGRFYKASASIIGELYSPKLRVNGTTLKPKDTMTKMQLEYGLQILYTYLLNARNEFRYCFFAYGACLRGFRAVIRPIIAIDETHLKGRFWGILFVTESRKSWSWFLKQLRNCIGCPKDCMFISDQHNGIAKAMEIVYPNASHGLSGFHMVMNINNRFNREDVMGIFKRASKCYKESEFIDKMNQLRRVHPNAYDYLMKIGKEKWSRAYSSRNEESTLFTVRSIDGNEFLVKDGDKDGMVNLIERTCTCGEFQIDIFPCKHVLAALRACRKPFIGFCSDHYKKSSLVEAYSGVIRPVGHKSEWGVPEDINSIVVNAPPWVSQAGQPKKSRISSSGEYRGKKSRTCSWCKQAGHNRQNCPTPLGFTVSSTSETQPTETCKQHKCGSCEG